MGRSLYVHLNRDGMKTLEPETRTFDTDGSFQIILENHGQPAHVHLHFDDDLAKIASLEDPNWYVPAGGIEPVQVRIPEGVSGVGELEVSTGYGAESCQIEIRVDAEKEQPAMTEPTVQSPPDPAPDEEGGRNLRRLLIPVVFVLVGIALAVIISIFFPDFVAVLIGALALIVAISVGGYLLVAE